MADYVISYSGGNITITPGASNNLGGLVLMGQNFANYGQNLNQNWVDILQSSASNVAPTNPVRGQLWFNTTSNTLAVNTTNGVGTWQTIVTGNAGGNITANVLTANYFVGDGSNLSNINGSNITGGNITTNVLTANFLIGNGSNLSNINGSNITGGNITTNVLTANFLIGNGSNLSNINGSNVGGIVGNARILTNGGVASIVAGLTGGTVTGNWTLAANSSMEATYADLAEFYSTDQVYEAGTVVEFGGQQEITLCDTDMTTRVAGVISSEPAYVMNKKISAKYINCVALQGRVPCKVIGYVHKGDLLVSAGNGCARAESNPVVGSVIGKSLVNKNTTEMEIIEVAVGRF